MHAHHHLLLLHLLCVHHGVLLPLELMLVCLVLLLGMLLLLLGLCPLRRLFLLFDLVARKGLRSEMRQRYSIDYLPCLTLVSLPYNLSRILWHWWWWYLTQLWIRNGGNKISSLGTVFPCAENTELVSYFKVLCRSCLKWLLRLVVVVRDSAEL
jgi:hypothetical protein